MAAAPPSCRRGDVGLRRPGVSLIAVAVLDHRRSAVVAGARLSQGKRGGAKGTLRRNPTDQPVGSSATGAMVDLMLTIDRMIAASLGIVLQSKLAEGREGGHDQAILSARHNGAAAASVPLRLTD